MGDFGRGKRVRKVTVLNTNVRGVVYNMGGGGATAIFFNAAPTEELWELLG